MALKLPTNGANMTSRNLVVAFVLTMGAGACGGGDESEPFAVYPREIFTGAEPGGSPAYKVPIVANDSSATFTLEGTCCTLVSLGNGEAELTANTPGAARIVVDGPEYDLDINVMVASYTAQQRTEGQQAYAARNCAMCHDGNSSGTNNDNTPSAIAEHPDDAVLLNIRTGNDPDGTIIRDFHKFQVPDGIVAYLRSLPARQKPREDLFTIPDEVELE